MRPERARVAGKTKFFLRMPSDISKFEAVALRQPFLYEGRLCGSKGVWKSYGKCFERIPHYLWASDVSLSNCFIRDNRIGTQPVSMRPPVLLRRSVGHPCPTAAVI